MGSYYYLAAQLPNLVYGQSAPINFGYFEELAEKFLDATDKAFFDMISLAPDSLGPEGDGTPSYAELPRSTGCEFIDKWREWERALRLNLARYRSQRLKRDNVVSVEPPLLPVEASAAAARAVAVSDSPLEAEEILDKARWDLIGSIQGLDSFSQDIIFAYKLKLLILERRLSFKTEEGFKEYKSLYAAILDSAQSVGEAK
ncbi:conserved hypothetical protein [Treponema primitia ZAS-2]|uniref:DUF2764 family protein n=1 Tax=Treponema primitia (strain ATCC BAA-887 / DSM 12427 / ZAS-2) TaxID=545694 RepID=F5YR76_TREPZ|nr:DUF2764 family protein [Treponema primitia]AEF83828.1 conserved hypothetical protein [Treponema primitia ZAS-2]